MNECKPLNLGVGVDAGRLPFLGCDSAHAAAGRGSHSCTSQLNLNRF